MVSKNQPVFQAVAVSDVDENEQQHYNQQHKSWTPAATKPPLLIALLCLVLILIALLQVAASKTVGFQHLTAELTPALAKRQQVYSTEVFTGFQETITGTTITWQPSTVPFPSVTLTYKLTTQTITGTTESLPGYTSYIYETVETIAGTPKTQYYELQTSGGSVSTHYVSFASAVTRAAYLDTATPVATSATISAAYLDTATAKESITVATSTLATTHTSTSHAATPSAVPPNVYLQQSSPSATSASSPTTSPSLSPTHFPHLTLPTIDRVVEGKYTTARYYVATYLPSILIILLKILWSHVFASAKLIEPFYRLSSTPNGATASSSLLAGYLSPSISTTGLTSMTTPRRPNMLIASLTTLLAAMFAPLAAESMAIRGTAKCLAEDGVTIASCLPVWTLDMICVRLLQALLAIIFVLIMAHFLLSLRSRNTSIYSDPSSINKITSLLGNRAFVNEIRTIPQHITQKDIRTMLAGNRYELCSFPSSNSGDPHGQAYGIVRTDNPNLPLYSPPSLPAFNPSTLPSDRGTQTLKALLPPITVVLFALTLFALILAYSLDYAHDPFNNFFSRNAFGPRFILSSLATILTHLFQRVEREVRVCMPSAMLHQLSTAAESEQAEVRAQRMMARGLPLTPYTSLPLSLLKSPRQPLLALLAFVAVLGDMLIIAVAGVPYSDAEIYAAYKWSLWLSISILACMMVAGVVAGLWQWRRRDGGDVPDTLLGAMRRVVDMGLDGGGHSNGKKRRGREKVGQPLLTGLDT